MALLPAGEPDELDRTARERPGDIAADLQGLSRIIFDQRVVVLFRVGRDDVIALVQDEMVEMIADVEVSGVCRAFVERPACRDERRLIARRVDLAAALDELARLQIGDDVAALFGEICARGVAGDVEGRRSAAEAD